MGLYQKNGTTLKKKNWGRNLENKEMGDITKSRYFQQGENLHTENPKCKISLI